MKAQTRMITISLVVIVLALSAIGGVTYSWFSDEEQAEVSITTGSINLNATYGDIVLRSFNEADKHVTVTDPNPDGIVATDTFHTGASFMMKQKSDSTSMSTPIIISNMSPGDSISFTMNVVAEPTINVVFVSDVEISEVIDSVKTSTKSSPFAVTVSNEITDGTPVSANNKFERSVSYTIKFQNSDNDDEFIGKQYSISIKLEAIQANAYVPPATGNINVNEYGEISGTATTEVNGQNVEVKFTGTVNGEPGNYTLYAVPSDASKISGFGPNVKGISFELVDEDGNELTEGFSAEVIAEFEGILDKNENPLIHVKDDGSMEVLNGDGVVYTISGSSTIIKFSTNSFSDYVIFEGNVADADVLYLVAPLLEGDVEINILANMESCIKSGKNSGIEFSKANSVLINGNGNTIKMYGPFESGSDWVSEKYIGLYVKNGPLSISNLTFENGKCAVNGTTLTADREQIYLTFSGNDSENGKDLIFKNVNFNGGLLLKDDAEFTECTFDMTRPANEAMYMFCLFIDNQYYANVESVEFNNCIFNGEERTFGVVKFANEQNSETKKITTELTFNNITVEKSSGSYPEQSYYKGMRPDIKVNGLTNIILTGTNIFSEKYGAIVATSGFVGEYHEGAKNCKISSDGETYSQMVPGWSYTDAETTVNSAKDLLLFAEYVNGYKYDFKKVTVHLGHDIDLDGVMWKPIGQTGSTEFKGIFDGQNHTISNLSVNSDSEGGNYSSGLFGWIESHGDGITIKNLKVDGASIVGHHNCAVIAGYVTGDALIENCHVSNATVVCISVNNDANGDKAGVIVGNLTGEVDTKMTKCSAENCTVSAGRDAGQLAGAGKETNVTDCNVTNVIVSSNGTSTGANINNSLVGRLL